MAEPATGGVLRTNIADMQVGDYIICKGYTGNPVVAFSSLGSYIGAEAPVTGIVKNGGAGAFYLIKTDKGLLISDRILIHSISWNELNSLDYIQGKTVTLSDANAVSYGFTVRSLGGGNSYASATDTSATTDQGLGAWPVDNEWDEYISKWNMIAEGKTLDDVFHFDVQSWIQETPSVGVKDSANTVMTNTYRIIRGNNANAKWTGGTGSAQIATWVGFRPVFEYKEVTP